MKKTIGLVLLTAWAAYAQVYVATVTAPGTGFGSTAPTVTASGGGCSSQPTFVSTVSGGTLSTVTPTFAGIGCTSAPALAIGGPGSGATATASILPASIAVLGNVPNAVGNSLQPAIGGAYLAWQFGCELIVPAPRVQFYAVTGIYNFHMPGTSQTTQFTAAPAGFQAALTLGIMSEYIDYVISTQADSLATVEAEMVTRCSGWQTAMNGWNPWASYGTRYFNGVWTPVVIN